ncbi:MAG: gliding-motility protein MglA, partial [Bdellovibrionaceae bacterium]|nr:gliding-motility protein MglA [Pseudobdellovibrionaceae bacterium]
GSAAEGRGVDESFKMVSKSILNMLKGGTNI